MENENRDSVKVVDPKDLSFRMPRGVMTSKDRAKRKCERARVYQQRARAADPEGFSKRAILYARAFRQKYPERVKAYALARTKRKQEANPKVKRELHSTNTNEISWAAGFFDGEGSTHFVKTSAGRAWPQLSISQIERSTLDRFRNSVFGLGKIYGPYSSGNPKHSPFWRYQTGGFEVGQSVFATLWKFLSRPKRDQISNSTLKSNSFNIERRRAALKVVFE